MSSFNCNGKWPFDNIDCYIDESQIRIDHRWKIVTKTFFIVYRRPISMLLQHKRILHNHRFALHASVPVKTSQRRSIEWTCDQVDKLDQLVDTLRVIASNHVDKLKLTCLAEQVRV
jgi:hypothetical protein